MIAATLLSEGKYHQVKSAREYDLTVFQGTISFNNELGSLDPLLIDGRPFSHGELNGMLIFYCFSHIFNEIINNDCN